jgi:hypothetical protein
MDRITYTRNRLTEHCLEMGILPVALSLAEWEITNYEDPSNLHKPYGWVPPIVDPHGRHPEPCLCAHCQEGADPETIHLPFCPELIAEQCTTLDDEEFEQYIDVLDWSFSLHVTHRETPWEEREALIDKLLYDAAEDSMALQNGVQMATLDRGLDGQPF